MARRSRRQKKQDQYMAETTSAQTDSLQAMAGISETISGMLQSEVGTRQQIVSIQKTHNGLADTYVKQIKKAVTELKKMPSAYEAAATAMSNQKRKEDQRNKNTNDKQLGLSLIHI